jgi:hypothetical protein
VDLILVLFRDELTNVEDFSPLLENRVEFLAASIDLAAIVLEDVGFFNIS